MKNKTYAPVPAVPALAVPSGWNIRRDGDVLIVQHPDIGGCSVQKEPDWERMIPEAILYSLADALLQSRAVKDFLTSQADCRACANRGKVNGLSQESFCDSCIWQGMSWRKDHHAPAVPDANPVQWLADEGDMILVPRGLLGAACSSIDKQRPAPKVLEALRYYTMNAPQAPAEPRKHHEFASVMLDAQPFITAEIYGGRYIVAMRFERLDKMQDCHAALLALLKSNGEQ